MMCSSNEPDLEQFVGAIIALTVPEMQLTKEEFYKTQAHSLFT